ncbi:MAG: TRAP transporter substrate-binding protein [Pseudomonadota bacterium]
MKKKNERRLSPSNKKGTKERDITRRGFIKKSSAIAVGAAIGTVGFPYIARSQTKKLLKPIVAGLNAKPGDPSYISIELIPKIMKEKYDIEIQINLHHSMTLGTDWSQMEAVQHGFIDITSNVTSNYAVFSDGWSFCDLPYMFPTRDKAWKFYKSDLFLEAGAKVEKDMGVKVLPAVDAGGHRLLSNNNRELRTPDDVNGLKFRTVRSPIAADLIRSWNGNPSPTAWAETYTAIQQGVINGIHVQPIWTYVFSFYEVLKYMTQVRAIYAIQMQVMNINTFNSMPSNIQKAFMAAAQEAADIANKKDRDLENDYTKKLQGKGMKLYVPTQEEFKKWYEAGQSVWEKHPIDPAILKKMEKL